MSTFKKLSIVLYSVHWSGTCVCSY